MNDPADITHLELLGAKTENLVRLARWMGVAVPNPLSRRQLADRLFLAIEHRRAEDRRARKRRQAQAPTVHMSHGHRG